MISLCLSVFTKVWCLGLGICKSNCFESKILKLSAKIGISRAPLRATPNLMEIFCLNRYVISMSLNFYIQHLYSGAFKLDFLRMVLPFTECGCPREKKAPPLSSIVKPRESLLANTSPLASSHPPSSEHLLSAFWLDLRPSPTRSACLFLIKSCRYLPYMTSIA